MAKLYTIKFCTNHMILLFLYELHINAAFIFMNIKIPMRGVKRNSVDNNFSFFRLKNLNST